MLKIALEEHFLAPGFEDYWAATVDNVPDAGRKALFAKLTDFGAQRLEAMAQGGIGLSVLSLAGPGVQAERDTAAAVRKARAANDFLAREILRAPKSYAGFAHLPMQDAKAAADELERCMSALGFHGAMINGHTHGVYLDAPALYPFWERAEALGALIYLHPADPVTRAPAIEGHPGLRRATWEWTMETGSHALRLVFSGLFDRFPKLTVALGHLGETLPYQLWRFDSRAELYGVKLARRPSQYIRENLAVTLSGMYSREPFLCALEALGADRVMFSADYPFESAKTAGDFLDAAALDAATRAAVSHGNARRLLRLA